MDDELARIRETLRRAGVDESRRSDEQLVLTVARLMDRLTNPADDATGWHTAPSPPDAA